MIYFDLRTGKVVITPSQHQPAQAPDPEPLKVKVKAEHFVDGVKVDDVEFDLLTSDTPPISISGNLPRVGKFGSVKGVIKGNRIFIKL